MAWPLRSLHGSHADPEVRTHFSESGCSQTPLRPLRRAQASASSAEAGQGQGLPCLDDRPQHKEPPHPAASQPQIPLTRAPNLRRNGDCEREAGGPRSPCGAPHGRDEATSPCPPQPDCRNASAPTASARDPPTPSVHPVSRSFAIHLPSPTLSVCFPLIQDRFDALSLQVLA